jgi:hypothetical protein
MQTASHSSSCDALEYERQSSDRRDLEHELAPAVLDACRSLWEEFAALSCLDPKMFSEDEHELLRWYAELQFRLGTGGGRCIECRAHVRHALPIRAEDYDGFVREFLCLCTRCLVAVEHVSDRIWYVVGDKLVEHPLRGGRVRRQAA